MKTLIINLLYPQPPALLGAIMGGIGLASGVQKLLGNEFASDEATAARDWSAQQAARQMDFQERMRATQYQTAVEDMKKAGLNPMLAYSQGGAGTPGGSMGSGGAASPANTGGTEMQTAAQIENIQAQTEKLRAEAENTRAQIPVTHGQVGIQNQTMALLREQAAQTEAYRHLNEEQQRLVREQIRNAVEENKRIIAQTGNVAVDTVLKQLSIPKAQNEARAQQTWWQETIAPHVGSAEQASRIFRNFAPRR